MARKKAKSRPVPKSLLAFFRTGWIEILNDDPEASTGIVQIIAENNILTEMTAIEFWERIIREADENICQNQNNQNLSNCSGEGSSQADNTMGMQLTGTDLYRLTTGDYKWFYYQYFPSKSKLIDNLMAKIDFDDIHHIIQMKLIKALHIHPTSNSPFQQITKTEMFIQENVEIEIIDQYVAKTEILSNGTEVQNGLTSEYNTISEISLPSAETWSTENLPITSEENISYVILTPENDEVQNGMTEIYTLSEISLPTDETRSTENFPTYTTSEESTSYEYFNGDDSFVATDTNIICSQFGAPVPQNHFSPPIYYYTPQLQYVSPPLQPSNEYIPQELFYNPQSTPERNMFSHIPQPASIQNHFVPPIYYYPQVPYVPRQEFLYNPQPTTVFPSIPPLPYFPPLPCPFPPLSYPFPPPQELHHPSGSIPRLELRTPQRNNFICYANPQQNIDQPSEHITEELSNLPLTPPSDSISNKKDFFSLEEIAQDALEFNFSVIKSDVYDNSVIQKQVFYNSEKYFRQNHIWKQIHDNKNTDNKNGITVENKTETNRNKNAEQTEDKPSVAKKSTLNTKRVQVDKLLPNKHKYIWFRRKNRKRYAELNDFNKKYLIAKKPDTITCRHQEEMKVCLDEEEKNLLENIPDKTKKFLSFKIKPKSLIQRLEKYNLDTWGTLQSINSLSTNSSLKYIAPVEKKSENITSRSRPSNSSNCRRVATKDQATQTSDEIVIQKTNRKVHKTTKLSYAEVLRKN